jgi:AAA family ATP:ADP antiporter
MFLRLRRFFDVRAGEGLPLLLAFLYIAVVVASFLLAKPIRNSLFLRQYGPYALVYVYAAVPLALTLFVPAYTRVAARFGSRAVTVWTLLFFSANVVMFWIAFRLYAGAGGGHVRGSLAWLLPGVFYVWVNCFGIIAPVQAWSFANSLFDTRQARRLFGLIGAGASLGAITGGLLARFLVRRVGGTVNMMLVLAALILSAAVIVTIANIRIHRRGLARRGRPVRHPFRDSLREIGANRYLRLMAALVFLVAIATQWTAFQLSLVADERFRGNADGMTAFFGTFNFTLGSVSFLLQLLLTGPALRRFGLVVTILLLPISLGIGSALILLVPGFWTVLLTNAADQGFRFSLDKATYELLYLPLAPGRRAPIKNAIDIVVNRFADAAGGILLGVATGGFFLIPGFGLGLRGTAVINLGLIALWIVTAWRLRREYVRTIHDSIHRYRLDTEQPSTKVLDRAAADALGAKLSAADPDDIRRALALVESQHAGRWHDALSELLSHPEADIRRRALAVLSAAGDRTIAGHVSEMLRDPDLGVRTEALLYVTREMRVDPLGQLQSLGEFEDFSIRAGMAAFLAASGPSQNLDAARLIIEAMARSAGVDGVRDRTEAARLLAILPDSFTDLLILLTGDEHPDVARQAIRSAHGLARDEVRPALVAALGRPEISDDAASALAHYGDAAIPEIEERLRDAATAVEIKRELPIVLVRIGTPWAERVLIESLLQPDVTLRHRIVISLNQLSRLHRDVHVDPQIVELLLAAEIAGHYRSYQIFGPLRARLEEDSTILEALRQSMEQELERIFRLMALLYPGTALHDAYVGVRSPDGMVRANALEFLDNILKPDLRQVLVPLLDSHVTVEERIVMADRIVGASLESAEQAVGTLLASGDVWLRSCAVYAVGALQLHGLEGELRKFQEAPDSSLRESVQIALQRLASEPEPTEAQPEPADIDIGVG